MPTKISATIVADSVCPRGHRITSMVLTFPRYILAEFNTHRMFSRNSASSRAIPFLKMVKAIEEDPFIPLTWMKDHPGMQGKEYLDEGDIHWAKQTWLAASEYAVKQAKILNQRYSVTKQMCNRLLEPYMWHTVIVTATEWENFFAQRFNEGADIHMQVLAEEMLNAMNASTPRKIKEGDWHIPFGNQINDDEIIRLWGNPKQIDYPDTTLWDLVQPYFIKISTAKCARVSYTLTGSAIKDDYEADVKLHDKLWSYPHPSPFEHCAQVPTADEYDINLQGKLHKSSIQPHLIYTVDNDIVKGWFGNFHGWKQYRKMLPNENQSDSRLIKK